MYIPEFWCGVAATIIVELIVVIGVAIFAPKQKEQNETK